VVEEDGAVANGGIDERCRDIGDVDGIEPGLRRLRSVAFDDSRFISVVLPPSKVVVTGLVVEVEGDGANLRVVVDIRRSRRRACFRF
jgi:hypothetical protein